MLKQRQVILVEGARIALVSQNAFKVEHCLWMVIEIEILQEVFNDNVGHRKGLWMLF